MELSSPLAAIRPAQCPGWGSPTATFGPGLFRAPAQSLAFDFASAFLDKSSHTSAPRSLFSSKLFQINASPLDVSPITRSSKPSKLASAFRPEPVFSPVSTKASQVVLPSINTALTSPVRRTSPKRPIDEVDTPIRTARPTDLKRPATRAFLSRSKAITTSSLERSLESLPPFKFGKPAATPAPAAQASPFGLSPITSSSDPSTPTLDECFFDSPIREPLPFPSALMAVSKPRLTPVSGPVSPAIQHRKLRVRAQTHSRRANSMFSSPADVMQESPTATAEPAQLDLEQKYELRLPHTLTENDSVPRINQTTLIGVLDGEFDEHFDHKIVVDCRFEYEYKGGHIDGAINYNDKEALAKELFGRPANSKTVIVLHCEYSVHRAPLMAKFLRQHDRAVNAHRYPNLSFPELYILEGGYSSFFNVHRTRCFPQNYVEMDDKEHEQACEKGMHKLRQRSRFSRAATYAFGEVRRSVEQSPLGRSVCQRMLFVSTASSMTKSSGGLFETKRTVQTRRMASY